MFHLKFLLLAAIAGLVNTEINVNSCENQANSRASLDTERIVNGQPARPEQFPWHATIHVQRSPRQWRFLTGVLIGPKWVVTLASGVRGSRETRIVVGSTSFRRGRQSFSTQIIPHPRFRNNPNRLFDIAVLCMEHPIVSSPTLRPISLPPAELARTRFDGDLVRFSGFGSDDPNRPFDNLKWVQMTVARNDICRLHFPRSAGTYFFCISTIRGQRPARPGFGGRGAGVIWRHKGVDYLVGLIETRRQTEGFSGVLNLASHAEWLRSFH